MIESNQVGMSDNTNTGIQRETKESQASLRNSSILYYSGFFAFIASLTVYFQLIRDQQQFRPFIDTRTFFDQSDPKIYAGQIHYSRIPVQYWEHRIQMVKAMGLNALSIYIMWNYHQIQRGKFDFETGNKNLAKFLGLAEKYQMKVLIRPGPYVCAEWDFGGLPARLLSIEGMQIRSRNQKFLQQVEIYFTALAPILIDHLWSVYQPQKCIIMLQIENQYGFFGTDLKYILELRKIWHKLKVRTAQYYVDWFINIRKSHWPGANIGLNDAFTQFQIDYIKLSLQNVGTVFGGEIYSGWLTHWHEDFMQRKDPYEKVKQYQYLMNHNISYAMYVVHGGTNFGLTAGANAAFRQQLGYGGHVTSYDYDAPINQQGSATQKYHVFKEAISKYADWQIPQIPQPLPMIQVPPVKPSLYGSLYHSINFEKPDLVSKKYYVFQTNQLKMFNQGIVLYRTKLPARSKGVYQIQVHDLGYLLVDGQFKQFLDRTISEHHHINISCQTNKECILDLFVQAMGHDNYDLSMNVDYKGLITFQSNITSDFEWKMYKIDLTDFSQVSSWSQIPGQKQELKNMPVVLKLQLPLQRTGDTYFNMTQFNKGYFWMNGHNIGRYWTIGPQYKIFCPGVWMSSQTPNEIYILQMMYKGEDNEFIGELKLYDE